MWWLLKTIGIGLGKAITIGEYERIRDENRRQSEYGVLVGLLDDVAGKRGGQCRPSQLSVNCPLATVYEQYYQDGRTSSGTAPLRMYTVIGPDGQIINIQCFDLMQMIKVSVQHTNGTFDMEEVEPKEALKRLEREAGYHAH
jgi:hypothetical protein